MRDFYRRFAADNREVARRYLKRDELFPEQVLAPVVDATWPPLTVEKAVEIAANLWVFQRQGLGDFAEETPYSSIDMANASIIPRWQVINAFEFILGRAPENEEVIASHQRLPSIRELRRRLLRSPEFFSSFAEETLHLSINVAYTSMIPRWQVINAFELILGRAPENEEVIASHQRLPSIHELRRVLLRSPEFSEKYSEIVPTKIHAETE
jgi:hypothetical protein